MRITRQIILLLCLLSGLSACHPDPNDDPPVVVTAEPEFRIDAYEQRDPGSGTAVFGLWVESMQLYDCPGYQIVSELRQSGQQIEMDLLDVLPPANCSGMPAPARQFVAIGQLAPGSYTLRLSLGKTIVNQGTLTVTNDQYTLHFTKPQGFEIQNYTARHLPDALVWGYVSVPDEAAAMAAQNFLADIKTITTDSGLAPGFYSYFTVSGTGEVFFHSSITPTGPSAMFVRKLNAAPIALKNLLQNYRSGVGQQQPLAVRCFSTQGEF